MDNRMVIIFLSLVFKDIARIGGFGLFEEVFSCLEREEIVLSFSIIYVIFN